MLVGHLGAGLAFKKLDPRINLGYIFISVLFLDIVLWIFILLGIEQVIIPENYAQLHYLTFIFPYSHSLTAALIWSLLVFIICRISFDKKFSLVLAAGVFSHFILDYIVHPPELPVTFGKNSVLMGLGVWNHMLFALFIEFSLVLFGLLIYIKNSRHLNPGKKYGLIIFMLLLCIFSFAGQLISPKPVGSLQIAVSSLVLLGVIVTTAYFIDRGSKRLIKNTTTVANNQS